MNLVTALRERGMQYIGTVRENRLKGCSLRLEKEIRKVLRRASGSCLEVNPGKMTVWWYENKKVKVITSIVGTEPMTMVKWFDKRKE